MSWAILRQVVLGTSDLSAELQLLPLAVGASAGFADPLLEQVGIVDHTVAVGGGCFLELVTPTRPDAPLRRWLDQRGGSGGYAVSVQVPDVAACRARAEARGVRVVMELTHAGATIIQLHPKDMGVLLELDGIADPDIWFWDDIASAPSSEPIADDILGIDVAVSDPRASAELWAYVLGLPAAGQSHLELGTRSVRFTAQGAAPGGLHALELRSVSGRIPSVAPASLGGVQLRYA